MQRYVDLVYSAALRQVPGDTHRAQDVAQVVFTTLARGRIDPSSTDWSVVDHRAASVLSPQQLSLFKRIEPIGGGQSRWMAQFDRAMQEARKSLAAGKPGG